MANKEASTAAGAWDKVVKDLGRPLNVYSDYGTEFKKESKQKLDYFDVDKIVSKGLATMAERAKAHCRCWTKKSMASSASRLATVQ